MNTDENRIHHNSARAGAATGTRSHLQAHPDRGAYSLAHYAGARPDPGD